MKKRILISGIIIAFFFLYLEWGGDHQAFVWQILGDVFRGGKSTFSHPFVLLPFMGIIGLMYSLVKPTANKILWTSLGLISVLVLMVLFISIVTVNLKMLISPLVILILIILLILSGRKKTSQ